MSLAYMTESEQLEQLKAWWGRYHRPILLTLSLIFLMIAGFRYLQWQRQSTNQRASIAYEQLMLAVSNHQSKAIRAYTNELITRYANTIYADSARMLQAKLAVNAGRYPEAVLALSKVVEHNKYRLLIDLAHLRLARIHSFQHQFDKAEAELQEIKNPNYKTLIAEQKGDIYFAETKLKQALKAYQTANQANEQEGIANLFLDMKQHNILALLSSNSVIQHS